MKMPFAKKLVAVLLILALSFSFTGCSVIDVDINNMMEAPKNDADMATIKEALDTDSRADYCYPQNGEYREAVIFTNIRSRSSKDAVAFTYDSNKRITISFFTFRSGEWRKMEDFTDKSDSIDRILFGDITGDGNLDMIVGFTNSEDKNVVSVFAYSEEKGKVEKIDTKFYYTTLLFTNFKSAEKNELCIIRKEFTQNENSERMAFSVVQYNNKKFYSLGSEYFETRLDTFENAFFDKDSDGKAYVAVEGMSLQGSYITQIITENSYTEKFYSPYSANYERNIPGEFKRSSSVKILSRDIDGDGSKEIPYMSQVTLTSISSAGYITDWVKPTIKSLTKETVMSSIVNTEDNYIIPIRALDRNNIAFYSGSDEDSLDVYYVETDGDGIILKATKLFTLRVFTKPMWKEYQEKEYTTYSLILNSRGDAVYAVKDLYESEITDFMLKGFSTIY